jgi:hypothetical protein
MVARLLTEVRRVMGYHSEQELRHAESREIIGLVYLRTKPAIDAVHPGLVVEVLLEKLKSGDVVEV